MRRTFYGLLVAGLLLGGLISGLTGTEYGSRLVVRTVVPWVPGELTVDRVKGRFLDSLTLGSIRHELPASTVELERLRLSFSPLDLLWGYVAFHQVEASTATVRLTSEPAEDPSPELPNLSSPVGIRVHQLEVQDLEIVSAELAEPLSIRRLVGGMSWGTTINMNSLTLRTDRGKLRLDGSLRPSGEYSHNLTSKVSRDGPETEPSVQGTVDLDGSLNRTAVELELEKPEQFEFEGELTDLLGTFGWQGKYRLHEFKPADYGLETPVRRLGLQGRAEGTVDSLRTSATIRTDRAGWEELSLRFDGAFQEDQLVVNQFELVHPGMGGEFGLSGYYPTTSAQGRISTRWRQPDWPAGDTTTRFIKAGELESERKVSDYQGRLNSDIQVSGFGEYRAQSGFTGDTVGVSWKDVRFQGPGGGVSGTGRFGWDRRFEWQFTGRVENLNPARVVETVPGSLSAKVQTSGRLQSGGAKGFVRVQDLKGTLRGESIQGEGELVLDEEEYRLLDASLRSGSDQITLGGSLGDRWDLSGRIELVELARWDERIQGTLTATGTLDGPYDKPRLVGEVQASEVQFDGSRLDSMKGTIQVNSDLEVESSVNLKVDSLRMKDRSPVDLVLEGAGGYDDHQFELAIHGQQNQSRLVLQGGIEERTWLGQVREIDIQSELHGEWSLREPARLVANQDYVHLAETCVVDDPATVCLRGSRSDNGSTVSVWGDSLSVDRLSSVLPDDVRATGQAGFDLSADYFGPQSIQADGEIRWPEGRLDYAPGDMIEEVVPVRDVRVDLTLAKDQARADWTAQFPDHGQLTGEVSVENPLPLANFQNRPLSGQATGRLDRLSLFHLLTDDLQWTSGQLELRTDFSGTVGSPRVDGQLELSQGQARLVGPGITVDELNGQIDATGDEIQGTISGRSDGGTAVLSGNMELNPEAGWPAKIKLEGENFLAADNSDLELRVSPNLTAEVEAPRIRLRGRVDVPRVRMSQLTDGEETVPISEDVVFVDDQESEEMGGLDNWTLDSRLRFTLGDDVLVGEGGFEGRLQGDVLVTDEPGRPTLAEGELEILDGKYQAYNRTLTIRSGRVIYARGPLDNPRLDLEAVRELREVTAGVRVRGFASNPRLSLFSEPPMEETDIISYIVLGRPASGASEQQGQMMMQAVSAAGFQGTNRLIETLERRLGFEALELRTEGNLEEGTFRIGRYLGPRLYVSYGVGLFDNEDQVILEYELSDSWTIEAIGGEHTSADLFYRFQ